MPHYRFKRAATCKSLFFKWGKIWSALWGRLCELNYSGIHRTLACTTTHSILIRRKIYLGRKIVRKSVLYIPCPEGPLFYLIYYIIINYKSRFVVSTKQLNECYSVAHTQAFKVCDVTDFECKPLFFDDLASLTITYINKARDGYYYINEHWI